MSLNSTDKDSYFDSKTVQNPVHAMEFFNLKSLQMVSLKEGTLCAQFGDNRSRIVATIVLKDMYKVSIVITPPLT